MKKISLIMSACLLGMISQAQLIDDFSSGLGAYTKSVVLEQDGVNAVSFAAPLGALQVSKTTGTTAEQVLLLRGDYSLGVGQVLRVDTAAPQSITAYADFGIAVSALVDPLDAVWTSGTADVRQDYVNVYLKRSTAAVGYVGFNGTVNAGASSGVFPPSFADITGLFISRTASDGFDVGYSTVSGDTVLHSFTGMNTSIGTALGFYADVRAVTTYGDLDNLRITAVPEPSTAALAGLGMLALIGRLRRRA